MRPTRVRNIVFFFFACEVLLNHLVKSAIEHYNNSSIVFPRAAHCSLHQVALEMVHFSSPPGSASYRKLNHVLSLNEKFHISLGPTIFSTTERSVARMLQGYGLRQAELSPAPSDHNVTLVETKWSKSRCPITDRDCRHQGRIIIQSEQYFGDHIQLCHESHNCVIFEFSDYNYEKAMKNNYAESFVLLPVMTQSPSRLSPFVPPVRKELKGRLHDFVFFGAMTARRREHLPRLLASHLKTCANCSVVISRDQHLPSIANAYKEAKVCLILHSYAKDSGGEYHRLSEVTPFGCVPVVESFSDRLGVSAYAAHGGVVFADIEELANATKVVLHMIDSGHFDHRINESVRWWNAGIQWELVLSSVPHNPHP